MTRYRKVSVMFRWMRSRRRPKAEPLSAPREADRDSAEEEYDAQEEDAREVGPSGLTRVKTDKI